MSVLKGEGTVPILFGATTIAAGTQNHHSYLARPDLAGEHPTVLIIPSAWGITSSVKDLSRRLARWGLAVIVMDPYRDSPPERSAPREVANAALARVSRRRIRSDAIDVVDFVANPAGYWSSAEHGFGLLGIGGGGPVAVELAASRGDVDGLALLYGELDDETTESLAKVSAPILGLYGKSDEVVSGEQRLAARDRAPHAEWVEYEGPGHDFLDDHLDDYDDVAAADSIERLVTFFEKNLP